MNNQTYPYHEILKKIKDLIMPDILEKINPLDIESTGLKKNDLAEVIFTQIMALGYNNMEINESLSDLMPTRNPVIYRGTHEEDSANMAMHLAIICQNYKFQILAFQTFHKMTQDLQPPDTTIREVKKLLLFT